MAGIFTRAVADVPVTAINSQKSPADSNRTAVPRFTNPWPKIVTCVSEPGAKLIGLIVSK